MWFCFESRDSGPGARDSKRAELESPALMNAPGSFAYGSRISISMIELRFRVAGFRIPGPEGSAA